MIQMRMKLLFFDAPQVQREVGAATRRALSRAGAFIRRRAKTSIRKRKKVSQPGNPPHSHAGHLRRLIFFAYDPAGQTVVIGPVPFRKDEAPRLLEFGGVTTRRPGSAGRTRWGTPIATYRDWGPRMVYRKRPFMGPAMEAEVPNLPGFFRNKAEGG